MPEQQHYSFGGGASTTVLHPLVLAILIVAAILVLLLPRKYIVVPFLLATFLVPLGQQIYVVGVHLFVLRLLILIGLVRVLIFSGVPRGKSKWAGGWTSIDTAFVAYLLIQATATVLLNQDAPALINQVGLVWDCVGGYLFLRVAIRTRGDILRAIACLAVLCTVQGIAMYIEQQKSLDMFGFLGGVNLVPEVREGKIRAQGVFQHSLTAGTFAATSIPLFFLLWKNGKSKILASAGIISAVAMTIATQTSTSLITFGSGVFAICFWPLRKKMRQVRLFLVAGIIGLDLVMKAPVWFLIARVDLTGSSSSYHRAELIDQFVRHFTSWWLIGTKDAAAWGLDMWDAQNMYVSVGEAGGLAALIFFILVISRSFSRLGNARKRAQTREQEWFLWFLGAVLFAHVTAFFGVNYFDQVRIVFYAALAMICAYTALIKKKSADTYPKINAGLGGHETPVDLAPQHSYRDVFSVRPF